MLKPTVRAHESGNTHAHIENLQLVPSKAKKLATITWNFELLIIRQNDFMLIAVLQEKMII